MYYVLISVELRIIDTYEKDKYKTEIVGPIFKNTLEEAEKVIQNIKSGNELKSLGKLQWNYIIDYIDFEIELVEVN